MEILINQTHNAKNGKTYRLEISRSLGFHHWRIYVNHTLDCCGERQMSLGNCIKYLNRAIERYNTVFDISPKIPKITYCEPPKTEVKTPQKRTAPSIEKLAESAVKQGKTAKDNPLKNKETEMPKQETSSIKQGAISTKPQTSITDNSVTPTTDEALSDKPIQAEIQDNRQTKSTKPRKPFTPYGLNGYFVDKKGNVRLMLDRKAHAHTIVLEPQMFNALAEMVRKTQEQHNDRNL